mgnify:CR=1 FL=1
MAHLTELRQLSRLHLHGIGHRRCLDALLVSTSKVSAGAGALLLLGVDVEGGCGPDGCVVFLASRQRMAELCLLCKVFLMDSIPCNCVEVRPVPC